MDKGKLDPSSAPYGNVLLSNISITFSIFLLCECCDSLQTTERDRQQERDKEREREFIWQQQQHPFNGPLFGATRVSRYQKGKTNRDLLKQEIVSGSGISGAICKYAPRCRQITMPSLHHSGFYRPDALPAAQPTASKQWRHSYSTHTTHNRFTALWNLSGKTRVSRYQKNIHPLLSS